LQALGRQARGQLFRYLVTKAEVAPGWTVTEYDDASLAGIDPFSRAMAKRVDKKERIAGVHVNVAGAFDLVNRCDLLAHAVFALVGVGEMRFVAGGHNHRVAIARSDVGQRHQDIDLPAMEAAVIVAELCALCAIVAAGMQADRLARSADIGEALIDEKRTVIIIKGVCATNEILDFFDPRRVVDQLLEGLAAFVDLLQIHAVVIPVGMTVHIALPFARLHWQQRVNGGVDIGDLLF